MFRCCVRLDSLLQLEPDANHDNSAHQTQQQPQAAQIQSFEGLSCGAFEPGSEVNFNHATTGFIPIQVLGDPFIEPTSPSAPELLACGGVFAQVGGGPDLTSNGGTLTNPGTVIYTDGTL